jgi:hypothetical protein
VLGEETPAPWGHFADAPLPRAIVKADRAASCSVLRVTRKAVASASGLTRSSTPAVGSGVPSVSSGARPGPDALYLPPAKAPQLENTGTWRAEPILISGAQSYRDGEWLYQDFLLDDHGATAAKDTAGAAAAGTSRGAGSGTAYDGHAASSRDVAGGLRQRDPGFLHVPCGFRPVWRVMVAG